MFDVEVNEASVSILVDLRQSMKICILFLMPFLKCASRYAKIPIFVSDIQSPPSVNDSS